MNDFMQLVFAGLFLVFLIYLVGKIVVKPFRLIFKIFFNSLFGVLLGAIILSVTLLES